MKIELTIKVDYLPTWGAYEGLRELLQNGKDAETEFNSPLEVRYRRDTNTVVIENEGCMIPHEALLFGHTTKLGRSEMIGKFGEGLKLGVLALVRKGHAVKIRSGSEVWVPRIERSEKFNADVLTFHIEKGRQEKDRVQVEVSGIPQDEWDAIKSKFLFLSSSVERVVTGRGDLLLSQEHIGKIFVKGIFVELDPKLKYGYDFNKDGVELDRDRKMVERYSLQYQTRAIWTEAMSRKSDLIGSFAELLDAEAMDIQGMDEYAAGYLPVETVKTVVERFKSEHGDTAVPVLDLAESREIEHLGRKGIVVNRQMKAVLQRELGTTDQIKLALKNEVTHQHSWGDLYPHEQANIEMAMELLEGAIDLSLEKIQIVSFRDSKLNGLYLSQSDTIQIAKRALATWDDALQILIHEAAHRKGIDGEYGHVVQMQKLWKAAARKLHERAVFA